MIIDELLLNIWGHAVESVELTLKVTSELRAGSNNLGHDLVTLLVGDAGSEREGLQVTSDTDTGGLDEGGLGLREGWADELVSVHVRDVRGGRGVTVILLDNLVKEVLEGGVGVLGASIAADS